MENLKVLIKEASLKIENLSKIIPFQELKKEIETIDDICNNTNIWGDKRKAKDLLVKRQKIENTLNSFDIFKKDVEFYLECLDLFPEEIKESEIVALAENINIFELRQLMSSEEDSLPAILTINAGAGGLEAANWTSMLMRMYLRFFVKNNFNVEILSLDPSEEHSSICIDSVSMRVTGEYAYGFLKKESGVFRLIRNSPFNAGDARHTSFAAISVMPEVSDEIEIKIDEKDLETTAQLSGGSGGQNVNKVASAIRMKHIPTGISVFVRNERDQLANRKIALKLIKSKLYEIELKKRQEEKDKLFNNMKDNAFGSQIRTLTMSPYQLVKDHRSNFETNSVDKVLDGDIFNLIKSNLK